MKANAYTALTALSVMPETLQERARMLTAALSNKQSENTAVNKAVIPEMPHFVPSRQDKKTSIHAPINQFAYKLIQGRGEVYKYLATYLINKTRVRVGIAKKTGKSVSFIVPADGPTSEGFHPVLTATGKAYAKLANPLHETAPWAPKMTAGKGMVFCAEDPEHRGDILDSEGEPVAGAVAIQKSVQLFAHSEWPCLLGDISRFARTYFTLSLKAKAFDQFRANEKWATLPGTRTLVLDWNGDRNWLLDPKNPENPEEQVCSSTGEPPTPADGDNPKLCTRLEYLDAQNCARIRNLIREDVTWAVQNATDIIDLDDSLRYAEGERKKVLSAERKVLVQEAKDTITGVGIAQRNTLSFLKRVNRLAGASEGFAIAANDDFMATK